MNKSSGGVTTLLLVGIGAMVAYQYSGPIGLLVVGIVLLLVNH